jgi:hypothetical protein
LGRGETRFGERSDSGDSREHHAGSVACYLPTVNCYLNSDYVRTGRRAWETAAVFGAQLGEVALKEKDLTQRTQRSERRGRGGRQEGFLTTRTPFGMTGWWAECWVDRLEWCRDPSTSRRGRRDAKWRDDRAWSLLFPLPKPILQPAAAKRTKHNLRPDPALGSSKSL